MLSKRLFPSARSSFLARDQERCLPFSFGTIGHAFRQFSLSRQVFTAVFFQRVSARVPKPSVCRNLLYTETKQRIGFSRRKICAAKRKIRRAYRAADKLRNYERKAFQNYLLENCGARRAFFKPYFFLSFALGSRVRNPSFLSAGRSSGCAWMSAREIP